MLQGELLVAVFLRTIHLAEDLGWGGRRLGLRRGIDLKGGREGKAGGTGEGRGLTSVIHAFKALFCRSPVVERGGAGSGLVEA